MNGRGVMVDVIETDDCIGVVPRTAIKAVVFLPRAFSYVEFIMVIS